MTDYKTYNISFDRFNLVAEQFDQPSRIHGIKHTYRVMLHCLRLGVITGLKKEATNAFFGAYIHDMAREHDGYCTKHGAEAAKFKLPAYLELFMKYGASNGDLNVIQQVVTWHSLPNEPVTDHLVWKTLAILKDADALDRIRLGANDLNPRFLRHMETHQCISFGKELYYRTNDIEIDGFNDVLEIANDIER